MSSQEAPEVPPPSIQSQTAESPIVGAPQGSTSNPSCIPTSARGSDSGSTVDVPVTDPPNINSGLAEAVTESPTSSSSAQRATHGIASDSSQDPVRAKFVTSNGHVVPPPSFSYSAFPRANSASGIPQQTSSTSAPQSPLDYLIERVDQLIISFDRFVEDYHRDQAELAKWHEEDRDWLDKQFKSIHGLFPQAPPPPPDDDDDFPFSF